MLANGHEGYRFTQIKIQDCDCCIEHHLAQFESRAKVINSPRVAAILTRLGYTPVIQEIFGTEPGDLRQTTAPKALDRALQKREILAPDR